YAVLEARAKAEPRSDKNRGNLAVALEAMGDISQRLQSQVAAKEYYLRALHLREENVHSPQSKELTPRERQQSLLSSYLKMYAVVNAPDDRELYANKALQLCSEMAREEPNDLKSKLNMASLYPFLADLNFQRGKLQAAQSFHQQNLQLWEELTRLRPDSVKAQVSLAMAHEALGDDLLILHQPQQAKNDYLSALGIYERFAKTEPDNVTYQHKLAMNHYRLGTACLHMGEEKNSQQHYQRSLDWRRSWLQKNPKNLDAQRAYMISLARCDQHEEAAQVAAQVAKATPTDGGSLYEVAGCYA